MKIHIQNFDVGLLCFQKNIIRSISMKLCTNFWRLFFLFAEEFIQCQLSPVFDDQGQILNNEFYLSFLAQLKGMALETYYIQQLRPEEGDSP